MSKTTALTIIIVTLMLIVGGLFWWYYSLSGGSLGNDNGGTKKTSTIGDFLPFGNTGSVPGRNNASSTKSGEEGEGGAAPEVREVSNTSVSGFTPLQNQVDGPYVRFMEQETGHVYDAPLSILGKRRVSNTTITKMSDVTWLSNGSQFIGRYLDNSNSIIQSFLADIVQPTPESSATSTEGRLVGKYLKDDMYELSRVGALEATTTNKNPARIFFLSKTGSGSAGYLANADGSKATLVFSSPLSEWLSYPINENSIYFATKPSGKTGGYLFSYNTKDQILLPVLKNITGLRILPNKDGRVIAYSETNAGLPHLRLYDTLKKTSRDLNLTTFADKCVFGNVNKNLLYCGVPSSFSSGLQPDVWYQGKETLNDSIWSVDVSNGETKSIADLFGNSYFLDIYKPNITPNDDYIIFQNKQNNSLWSVHLKK